jgi:glycosyltransferase involved in cell wall biosynthesis
MSMKLPILMIGPFPVDETRVEGGVQASVLGLARGLRDRPEIASVRIMAVPTRVGGDRCHDEVIGIPVDRLRAPGPILASMITELPAVVRAARAEPGTVVHLHGSGPFEFAILLACRSVRVPVVWTLHGLTEKETRESWRRQPSFTAWLRYRLYRFCERSQLRLARTLVVDTAYVAEAVAPLAAATPLAVPQGVDIAELLAYRDTRRRGALVLSLGVIEPRKGHLLTLSAFATVARRLPEARLEIVGALRSPDHLAEIHAAIERLGLADRVRVLTDRPRAEILEALGRARVMALHSEEESQGIALCEAMAVGLPIVATRVGGIPDVIGDSEAGTLVAFGDVAGMAAALVALIEDDEASDRASQAAIVRAAAFDWNDVSARLVRLYRAARPDTTATPTADETVGSRPPH